jgi:nicotinamide phosphoribosyltransferase
MFFQQNNVPLNFVNYGIGAGFYKHIDRDTLGWAMKTAFSNGKPRMKFSEDPLKRSTPGEIGIYRNDQRELVVEEANLFTKDPKLVNLFQIIYEYNGTHMYVRPLANLETIRLRTQLDDDDNIMQRQIYIKNSDAVKNLIREFKNRYKKRNVANETDL